MGMTPWLAKEDRMAHTPATPAIPGGLSVEPVPATRNGRSPGRASAGIVLDHLSKQIIEQLQEDGRRSYASIGKAVGLSEAAVRQRVQRLIDTGVMQVVAVTDPLELGFARQAMIGIRCTGDTTKVAEKLAAIESVDYVVLTAGSFDAIVEVVCEDDDDLLDLLNTKIRALPGVISTETLVYLRLVKQQYNWGTR
jgi:Lrp/AsnC family transcriptional regulator for asnA, asnC and gidA